MNWTKDEDAMLVETWTKGHVGIVRQIAGMLERTRNSVISRAHRLGLPDLKTKQKMIQRKRLRVRSNGPPVAPPPNPPPPKITEIPPEQLWTWAEQRTPLIELTSDQCAWPVGYLECCGGERLKDKPYCALHTSIAFGLGRKV